MAYKVINIEPGVWTDLEVDCDTDFQLIGDRECYWKYSLTQPTGIPPSDESANYVINNQIYSTSLENGNVWIYSTIGCNIEVGVKAISNIRLFSKYSPKSLIPLNQILFSTTIAVQTVRNEHEITVVDASGISIDDYIILFNNDIDNAYYGFVRDITVNTLEMNVPLNDNFPIGSNVDSTTIFMNVVGTKEAPQIFRRRGEASSDNLRNILVGNRFMILCKTNTEINFNEFGDLPALENGLVFRERDRNGKDRHLFTVNTNAEIAEIAFDFRLLSVTNPAQGVYGFVARLTFGGESKLGAAIGMPPTGDIIATVQDDLSDLIELTVTPEGYFLC